MWDELRLRLCKCPEGRRQVKGKKKRKKFSVVMTFHYRALTVKKGPLISICSQPLKASMHF